MLNDVSSASHKALHACYVWQPRTFSAFPSDRGGTGEKTPQKTLLSFFFPVFFFTGYKQNTQIMFGKNECSMPSLGMDCPSQRALAKMIEINDSVHGTETSNGTKKCGTRISRRECTSLSTARYNHAFRCMRQRLRKRS